MQLELSWKFPFVHKRATINMPSATLDDWFRTVSYDSDAGVNVSPDTALTLSAVWRAINLLSSTLATMPVDVFKKNKDGSRQEADVQGLRLFNNPSQDVMPVIFREALMTSVLTWGNGYAYITRNRSYEPTALDFVDPQDVVVKRAGNRVFYEIKNFKDNLSSDRMLHIPALSFNGVIGKGPIEVARQSLGGGLAVQKFGNQFFKNGAKSSGILSHPMQLSDKARENLRDKFEKRMKGGDGGTMILEEGIKYQPISIPPEQAQFLQSRKFTVEEVARWFGVPPHLLSDLDRATFSNIEHQGIEFVVYSLTPWVVRWEQELNRKLLSFSERKNHFFKFNMNGLLRGDSKARAEYYRLLLDMGVLSINEVRQLEEFNNIKGGDQHLVQLARTPLDKIGKEDGTEA